MRPALGPSVMTQYTQYVPLGTAAVFEVWLLPLADSPMPLAINVPSYPARSVS